MKKIGRQLGLFFEESTMKANAWTLLKFLLVAVGVVVLFSTLLVLIMDRVEGRTYSWFDGLDSTMVTMSTLGFGDIVFATRVGRLISVVVLLTGVLLILVLFPFVFIRYFYAPWLEAGPAFGRPGRSRPRSPSPRWPP